jgi:hypothetical protein
MLIAANGCSGSTDTKKTNPDADTSEGSSPSTSGGTTTGGTTNGGSSIVTGGVVTSNVGPTTTGSSVSAGGATSTSVTSADGGIAGDAGAPGTTTVGTGGFAGESGVDTGQGGAAGAATGGTHQIAACEDRQAATCPSGTPLCATRDGAGTSGTSGGKFISDSTDYSFCTEECETSGDCEFDMTGVSAEILCAPFSGSNASVCSLDCSFGRTCPEGMACYSNTCMFEHRTCSCTGDCDGTECD